MRQDEALVGGRQRGGLEEEPAGLPGRVAGVFQGKLRLPALEDRLQAGEDVLSLGAPGGGGPSTHVQVVQSDAGSGHGRRLVRAAEALPGRIDRHDGAPGVQDGDVGGEGLERRVRPRLRCV
jgi:hypothetical protein